MPAGTADRKHVRGRVKDRLDRAVRAVVRPVQGEFDSSPDARVVPGPREHRRHSRSDAVAWAIPEFLGLRGSRRAPTMPAMSNLNATHTSPVVQSVDEATTQAVLGGSITVR